VGEGAGEGCCFVTKFRAEVMVFSKDPVKVGVTGNVVGVFTKFGDARLETIFWKIPKFTSISNQKKYQQETHNTTLEFQDLAKIEVRLGTPTPTFAPFNENKYMGVFLFQGTGVTLVGKILSVDF
jgi:hypothetical protein